MPTANIQARPLWIACLVLFTLPCSSQASVIGTNPPALALTAERIATLPKTEQPAWLAYLDRSESQRKADRQFFQDEFKKSVLREPVVPPAGRGVFGIGLDRSSKWYSSSEARRVADIIISFQTPAVGWSKNLDMTRHKRAAGERFAHGNLSKYPGEGDYDAAKDPDWNYVCTFDNDATITQLRFLAKIATAPGDKGEAYRSSFLRGLDYVLNSQYPNGGWPQVWPLQGGYHDAITFNDAAMVNTLNLLRSVAEKRADLSFVPEDLRQKCAASLDRGLQCVLATQIIVAGQRTVWCQQNDMLTLQPTSARNYEMPCAVSGESARMLDFLLDQPNPNAEVLDAIKGATLWFERTAIRDIAFRFNSSEGRHVVIAPGNGPIWSRYYEIGTDRPIFGERDKTIHDDLSDISLERRNGYSWYNDAARDVLARYRAK